MKKLIIIFFVLSTFFLLTDCHKSEYHRQLSQQLASGTRFDTIIFDIYFGMARKDFYTYCWEGTKHDRDITTDHGWKIVLSRGLDVFQRCELNDAFSFANRMQQHRQCKEFNVTFVKLQ